jgi:hypothetical protein
MTMEGDYLPTPRQVGYGLCYQTTRLLAFSVHVRKIYFASWWGGTRRVVPTIVDLAALEVSERTLNRGNGLLTSGNDGQLLQRRLASEF